MNVILNMLDQAETFTLAFHALLITSTLFVRYSKLQRFLIVNHISSYAIGMFVVTTLCNIAILYNVYIEESIMIKAIAIIGVTFLTLTFLGLTLLETGEISEKV